ncbi:MAG: hypothetical protein ACRDU5_14015 [Mycobacterium sp.]
MWEEAFTRVYREAPHPGGTPWEGEAADAATVRVGSDRLSALGAVDSLRGAASLARTGAAQLQGARQIALEAVRKTRVAGFAVGEDLSVTSRQTGGQPALQATRQAQAEGFAATIRRCAASLAATDTEVANRITAAMAGVTGISFASNPVLPDPQKQEPTIQPVDNRRRKETPIPSPGGPDNLGGSGGRTAPDIRAAIEGLPRGNKPWIKEIRSVEDLRRLWDWVNKGASERVGSYGETPGSMRVLPDGTIVGIRDAAGSNGKPALDIRFPGEKEYVKVHINPRGGVPDIPSSSGEPARGPTVRAPAEGPVKPPSPPPVEPTPRVPVQLPVGPPLVYPPNGVPDLSPPPGAGLEDELPTLGEINLPGERE